MNRHPYPEEPSLRVGAFIFAMYIADKHPLAACIGVALVGLGIFFAL